MAISGSLMAACLQYRHPLMNLFRTKDQKSNDEILSRFFNEYYCEADVDIMIKTDDNFEFLDIVDNIYKNIEENIKTFMCLKDNEVCIKKEILKKCCFFVSEDYIKNNFCQNLSYEFVISNLNSQTIKNILFTTLGEKHKQKINQLLDDFDEEEISNLKVKYPEFFVFDISNIEIKLSSKDNNKFLSKINKNINLTQDQIDKCLENISSNSSKDTNNDINCCISFKGKIYSPFLDHSLEIFTIKGDDFFSCVNNFHLPCVRSYYDGENVYMTPSCISAHLTYMNINYKYVASTKDPIDIINKYRMRGFGIFLNKKEIKLFIKYCTKSLFWNILYNVNEADPKTYRNCLGYLPYSHKIFHPRLYNADYYMNKNNIRYIDISNENLYNNILSPTGGNYDNTYLCQRYNSLKLYDVFKDFKTQDRISGNIKPFQEYIVEFVLNKYKIYNNKSNILPEVP
jgi:hypothetical protein